MKRVKRKIYNFSFKRPVSSCLKSFLKALSPPLPSCTNEAKAKALIKNEKAQCWDGKEYFYCHNLQNVDNPSRFMLFYSIMQQNPWCRLFLSYFKETPSLAGFWHWRGRVWILTGLGEALFSLGWVYNNALSKVAGLPHTVADPMACVMHWKRQLWHACSHCWTLNNKAPRWENCLMHDKTSSMLLQPLVFEKRLNFCVEVTKERYFLFIYSFF